jgi:hypothetical protein
MDDEDKVEDFSWLEEGQEIEIAARVESIRNRHIKLLIGDKEITLDGDIFMEVLIGA